LNNLKNPELYRALLHILNMRHFPEPLVFSCLGWGRRLNWVVISSGENKSMRMMTSWTGIMLLGLLVSGPVLAEDQTLSWEDCVREAATNNPDLAAQAERVRQSESSLQIALSPMLPQVSSGLSFNSYRYDNYRSDQQWNAHLSVQQLLFDGLQSLRGYQGAEASLAAARYDYAVVEAEVRLRLRQAFVELLRAQLLIGLSRDIEQQRRKNLDLVQMRYEAGREHRGSLLLAQAQLAQAQASQAQAERALLLAQHGLLQQLGRQAFSPLQAGGLDLRLTSMPGSAPDYEALIRQHPGYQSLTSQAESARLAAAGAAGDWYPNLSLSGSMGRSGSDGWPGDTSLSGGLSLSWPLFTGWRRWSEVDRAQAAWRQAQASLASGGNTLRYDLVSAWNDYNQAVEDAAVQAKFLDAAEERARIAQVQYKTGLIGFDNWIIIEDDLVSAKQSALSAQARSQNAKAAWVQAQGGGLNVSEP
jgi:outer membrane protein TolC